MADIIIVPEEGLKILAQRANGNDLSSVVWQLALFTNTPLAFNHSTVWGDLTEASHSGYARAGAATWGAPTIDGSFRAVSAGAQRSFAVTGGTSNVITGVAVIDPTGMTPKIIMAKLWDVPKVLDVDHPLVIDPILRLAAA